MKHGTRSNRGNGMNIPDSIKKRRSIRSFNHKPVEPAKVRLLLEAATWAPSWTNSQPWRFVIVTDPDVKNRIAGVMPANRGLNGLKEAPILIVVCAKTGVSGYLKGKPVTDKGDWFMFDTALSIQNILLTAESIGLGTLVIGYFDAEKTASLIGLPKDHAVVALIPVGYTEQKPEPPPRKSIHAVGFLNRFGDPLQL